MLKLASLLADVVLVIALGGPLLYLVLTYPLIPYFVGAFTLGILLSKLVRAIRGQIL